MKPVNGYHTHPYRRLSFWNNPANQFWNTETHSQKSKDYFNNWLQGMNDAEHGKQYKGSRSVKI